MLTRQTASHDLPACVTDSIRAVVKRMHYKPSVRAEVRQELLDHFSDTLADCPPQQRDQRATQLLADFGDPKLLGTLIRRAKKRARPLRRKVLIRVFQVFAGLFVLLSAYVLWIATGQPTFRIDYVAQLNRMNQASTDESLNAWPDYDQAIRAHRKPPVTVPRPTTPSDEDELNPPEPLSWQQVALLDRPLAPSPPFEQQAVRAYLDDNATAWDHYLAASRKPLCWVRYTLDPAYASVPAMYALRPPELGNFRELGRIGIWQSRFARQAGRLDEALDDCLTVARAGRHWQKPNDVLICQWVGLAISSLSHQEILNILAAEPLSLEQLNRTQEQLEALYPAGYPLISPTAEKLFFHDAMQWLFTEGGPGGGHPVPHNLQIALGAGICRWGENGPRLLDALLAAVQAGRTATLQQGDAMYDLMAEQLATSPYQRRNDTRNVDNMLMQLPRWRYVALYVMIPSFDRAGVTAFQGRALHQATLTVLALHRYKREKGVYPETLDNLVSAGYLKQVPEDPYTAGPLVYRVTGDAFTLYSVASNFADDSGTPIADDGWDPDPRGKAGGDHVFWPVQPYKAPKDE